MSDEDSREILTWEQFGIASRELAQKIANSGFDPEIVVSVARGGMIPAGALSYALGKKLNDCINVEFYTDIGKTLPDPILLAPLLDGDAMVGRRLLVVDDVVDSGRTMALVAKLLRGFGADTRSAVLYTKPTTVIVPDFSWKDTDKWIDFPWSVLPPVEPVLF
jgi:hypoxanthine phosphoribosyltransferase